MKTVNSALSDTRVFYRDIKPYEAPERLDDLHGPSTGMLTLPINVYWGPQDAVDLSTPGGVAKVYQAALREGRVVDQVEFLNRDVLIKAWPELILPVRVRSLWEHRFPVLAAAA